MFSVITKYYRMPILIAITLIVVMTALNTVREPLQIAAIILGAFIGIFVFDLEFIIYAYFLEPQRDFSRTLATFLKHHDYKNALNFMNFNSGEIQEKTLNSALFQIAVAALSVFVISSDTFILAKALVLSVFANSIYKFSEYYFNDKLNEWFWALKEKPNKSGAMLYITVVCLVFVYCLYIY